MKRRSAKRKSVKRVSVEVRDARRESGETQTRERAGKRGSGVGAGKPGWNVSSRRDDGIWAVSEHKNVEIREDFGSRSGEAHPFFIFWETILSVLPEGLFFSGIDSLWK